MFFFFFYYYWWFVFGSECVVSKPEKMAAYSNLCWYFPNCAWLFTDNNLKLCLWSCKFNGVIFNLKWLWVSSKHFLQIRDWNNLLKYIHGLFNVKRKPYKKVTITYLNKENILMSVITICLYRLHIYVCVFRCSIEKL